MGIHLGIVSNGHFHLVNIFFPLLVLKGIYHYWTFFFKGLKQMEGNAKQILPRPRAEPGGIHGGQPSRRGGGLRERGWVYGTVRKKGNAVSCFQSAPYPAEYVLFLLGNPEMASVSSWFPLKTTRTSWQQAPEKASHPVAFPRPWPKTSAEVSFAAVRRDGSVVTWGGHYLEPWPWDLDGSLLYSLRWAFCVLGFGP